MIEGIDISHHNAKAVYSNKIDMNSYKFVIMKATEGSDFVDSEFRNYNDRLNDNIIRGYYHFARPDKNPNPFTEAYHFMKTIGTLGENALLVLDWEGKALKYPITWALLWLKHIEQYYGKKPLLYCSESYVKHTKIILNNDNGLWVAKYGKKTPNVKPYRHYALWQYSSTPFDKNIFNGTEQQLRKYCERKKGSAEEFKNYYIKVK